MREEAILCKLEEEGAFYRAIEAIIVESCEMHYACRLLGDHGTHEHGESTGRTGLPRCGHNEIL